ncbi:hypothetical protein EJ02DRAFT_146821 [Clathrospora elynae]|uniref:Uncharacterized protein n=1 Tax=Clathrospora elynae TaxID=706981 RepID=A0A6A5SRV7_9PLEO|nr:hypothetical protein EJ02DRAFT_146821 [Clathrospora elynae]
MRISLCVCVSATSEVVCYTIEGIAVFIDGRRTASGYLLAIIYFISSLSNPCLFSQSSQIFHHTFAIHGHKRWVIGAYVRGGYIPLDEAHPAIGPYDSKLHDAQATADKPWVVFYVGRTPSHRDPRATSIRHTRVARTFDI